MKSILSLILILFFSLNSIGQVVNVTNYGATPNDPSDNDKNGISAALTACRKLSKPILYFPKGIYNIHESNGPIFEIAGINNLLIQGSGSKLMVIGKQYKANKPIFFFQDCKNLSIKNISVDYESVPWSQGKVINSGEDFMDVKLFEGEGFDIEGKTIKAYAQYDSIQGQQINMKETYKKSDWEWIDKNKNIIRVKPNPEAKLIYEPNSYIVMRHAMYDNNTFIIYSGCEDVLFENVTVYACGGYPFNAYASKNLTFKNCNILRKSDKHWVTSTADGAHLLDVRGEVIFENCFFENMCDDGINLHGYFQNILEAKGTTITVSGKKKHKWYTAKSFSVGDEIIIVDAETQETIQKNVIKKIASQQGNLMTIKLEKKLPELEPQLEDTQEGEITRYKMANASTIAKLTVDGCTFKKNRARGMLISSIDATIKNCTFERTQLRGVLMEVSNYWIESTPAVNLTIENNTFIDCNFSSNNDKNGVISLEAQITSKSDAPINNVFKDISILNNTFINNKIPMVVARHVNGLTIKGNKIENPRESGNIIRYGECINTNLADNDNAIIELIEGRIEKH